LKIAILGTRGIPNNYGGFEQFAEYLSYELAERGHDVYVYSPHYHPYKKGSWNKVNIIHQQDPEKKIGTLGQFIYDFNCITNARNKNFDVILQLGYTSSSIWGWLMPKKSVIITNMDGLEWKRSKYTAYVQFFLKHAEHLGVIFSDYLVSDSIGIQNYLLNKYKKHSTYIPYGAHIPKSYSLNTLKEFNVNPFEYNLLIARLEPENSISIILDAVKDSKSSFVFFVVGNCETKYGQFLKKKYLHPKIVFLNSIYDINILNDLRHFSNLYFHGHTVGGTNPSLLEAMASSALICAHNNQFNSSILGPDAFYFQSSDDIKEILKSRIYESERLTKVQANLSKIKTLYSWKEICDSYELLMKNVVYK